ncbi:MAG: putative bifunctional diguanylate cyclase/phosphodiesterase [Pseudomonadota bacterium]
MNAASPIDRECRRGGDWLTGFFDRGQCTAQLAGMIADSHDSARPVAVCWVDIDRFRQINHSFGYAVGDSVLVELGRRLSRCKPPGAQLARMGGDEFVVLVPAGQATDVMALGRALARAVNQPLGIGTTRMRPSASIGIAMAQLEEDGLALLERAERAMHEAKREGGGRAHLAADAMLPARGGKYLAREELMVEETLHRALELGGLYLHYQPIVRLDDGLPLAAEALMRCQVDGQHMPPGRFIPVAEKTGLVSHLGDWSLMSAAETIGRLNRLGLALRLAVNVSRVQLQCPGFAKSLHGVIACTGVDPGLLELEITESLFMDTSDVVRKNLRAAMAAGFPLALDDFGTGYSSLACLKDLPAAKIKLDRAFVVDLPHDMRSFGVARAVAQLAGDLGISVVAEGVETAQQMAVLGEAGVHSVQGFHIARPMPEADLFEWLPRHGGGHG